jgi:hypothetical protein
VVAGEGLTEARGGRQWGDRSGDQVQCDGHERMGIFFLSQIETCKLTGGS